MSVPDPAMHHADAGKRLPSQRVRGAQKSNRSSRLHPRREQHREIGDELEVWIILRRHLDQQPSDELDPRTLEDAEVDQSVVLLSTEGAELGREL